ncbi:hypothetical protein ADICYQ_0662 [Cyclobacterium qasimii M12-11B]|uniref:Uncharacterized protein n=1 Tax=Cyclobacterium qasimii M12-11B TaxID=641524 RepID=S7VM97_9BACT|nr:hypothetical protein ADICYQ_0662 [Cyclobacterium qasimii M12-11B]
MKINIFKKLVTTVNTYVLAVDFLKYALYIRIFQFVFFKLMIPDKEYLLNTAFLMKLSEKQTEKL